MDRYLAFLKEVSTAYRRWDVYRSMQCIPVQGLLLCMRSAGGTYTTFPVVIKPIDGATVANEPPEKMSHCLAVVRVIRAAAA